MELPGKFNIKMKKRGEIWNIYALGDFHLDNVGCATNKLHRTITAIEKDPYARAVCVGDYQDFISYQDKRFDPSAVDPKRTIASLASLGMESMQAVKELLLPIKDKILTVGAGNHEKTYQKHMQQEFLTIWLAQELGVPYGGYSCFFDLSFDLFKHKNSFRFFVHHGYTCSRTSSAKFRRLIETMKFIDADIIILGHSHDNIKHTRISLGANAPCTELVERIQHGAVSGGYLRTYVEGVTTYGEQKLYPPAPLGSAIFKIHPFTREIDVCF